MRYFAHANHLFSTSAVTNRTGQVVERYSYNAYGVRTVKNPAGVVLAKTTVNSDRGFTGYKLDVETALYAARARMYSGRLGRFVGRDPSGYVDGFSLYSGYFAPNGLDPTGLLLCYTGLYFGHSGGVGDWWDKQRVRIDKDVFKDTCSYKFGSVSCSPRNANDIIDHDRNQPQWNAGPRAGHGMDWGLDKGVFDSLLNKDQYLEFRKMGEAAQVALKDALSKACNKECCTEWTIEVTCHKDVATALMGSLGSNVGDAVARGLCGVGGNRTFKGKCVDGKATETTAIESVINSLVRQEKK